MSSSPFINICVQPSYGRNRAIIQWVVQRKFTDGDFYIYRSQNGLEPWLCINPTADDGSPLPVHGTSFEDTNLLPYNLTQDPHYRICLEHELGEFDSPVVATYERLTRSQYATVYKILKRELMRMRHTGVKVWHFRPLMEGTPNPNRDPLSNQVMTTNCDPNAVDSYGLPFLGGFGEPVLTYIEKGQETYAKRTNGDLAMEEFSLMEAQFLAYPAPVQNSVIVQPESDTRWVVLGETIKPKSFRGIAIVGYTATIRQLSHTDERFRLQVPPVPCGDMFAKP